MREEMQEKEKKKREVRHSFLLCDLPDFAPVLFVFFAPFASSRSHGCGCAARDDLRF